MLDDLKYISQLDSDDALGVVSQQFKQLLHRFEVTGKPSSTAVRTVIVAGMGGSALAPTFVETWPGLSVPFLVVRDYVLPDWIDEHTLIIASSYSGNTEETLSALSQAENAGTQIAIITSGGYLAQRANEKDYPSALLPTGLQPRMAPFYAFKALLTVLQAFSLVQAEVIDELEQVAQKMSAAPAQWTADIPIVDNQAKQLALQMEGKTPIIYAGKKLYPAAYKWKINCNENAKNTAWSNQLPEFNHNEFLGWSSHPVQKPFAVINLRSSFEHPQVQKRFEISDRLLSGKRPAAISVHAKGETILEQLLWVVALGDMTSVYLALLNGLNPTPVDLIEKLKIELK